MEQEQRIRNLLLAYGKKLADTGLVQGTWGNLSMRLSQTHMIVTPSGLDYYRLAAKNMVKVEIDTLAYAGSLKPTSESGIHGGVYRKRPEIGAVIHTHSKYCSVFAAAGKDVPVEEKQLQKIFGNRVTLAEYALPGTEALWNHTIEALGENHGCIMANHGMLCTGRTIEEAFENCLKLEEYCGRYIESRYALLQKAKEGE